MQFVDYKANFPYLGKSVYSRLFTLHCKNIKTKKERFAVNNLEKNIQGDLQDFFKNWFS